MLASALISSFSHNVGLPMRLIYLSMPLMMIYLGKNMCWLSNPLIEEASDHDYYNHIRSQLTKGLIFFIDMKTTKKSITRL